jgi:hypothetical protein
MSRRKLAAIAVAATLGAVQPAPSLAQEAQRQVGVAAAVVGPVQLAAATPGQAGAPGGVGNIVQSGQPIRLGDRISTGPGGRLQIMLLDETVFTIGPNAVLVVDEFVFDPASGRGRISAGILRGSFRFVTGKIANSNPDDMRVSVPVGTMGIRGTIVAGDAQADRALIVLLGPGEQNNAAERIGRVLVTGLNTAQGGVELRRAGFAVDINGRGAAPGQKV